MVRSSVLGYWSLAVLAVLVALASLRLLSFNPNKIAAEIRPNLIDHPVPFYLHTIIGPIALLIGIWQFLPRTRSGRWHRRAGRVYVACCAVGAATGFTIALTTVGGRGAAAGFAIPAVLWLVTTCRAFALARDRRFAEHRRWMMRSYAIACAAITQRLVLAGGLVAGLPFSQAYGLSAWACWVINLLIVEALILLGRPRLAAGAV